MWPDIIRIFLTVVLSITFLILFGGNNINRYLEGAIGKISDEEFMKQENIPVPGDFFCFLLYSSIFSCKEAALEVLLYVSDSKDLVNLYSFNVSQNSSTHFTSSNYGYLKSQSQVIFRQTWTVPCIVVLLLLQNGSFGQVI